MTGLILVALLALKITVMPDAHGELPPLVLVESPEPIEGLDVMTKELCAKHGDGAIIYYMIPATTHEGFGTPVAYEHVICGDTVKTGG